MKWFYELTSIFQMIIFLQEMGHLPVGITVGGFFMITKESVLTVSVLIITKESVLTASKAHNHVNIIEKLFYILFLLSSVGVSCLIPAH